jgi:5'-deoxynucleotidase YfbR-like HD superfamily hydrolase
MTKAYSKINTNSGIAYDLNNFSKADVELDDICRALGGINRFVGHTKRPVSVASHSLAVGAIVPEDIRLEGLMHDAAEAYMGDFPSPLKALLGKKFRFIEDNVEFVIADKYNLGRHHKHIVKWADLVILALEAEAFFKEYNGWAHKIYESYFHEPFPKEVKFPRQAYDYKNPGLMLKRQIDKELLKRNRKCH